MRNIFYGICSSVGSYTDLFADGDNEIVKEENIWHTMYMNALDIVKGSYWIFLILGIVGMLICSGIISLQYIIPTKGSDRSDAKSNLGWLLGGSFFFFMLLTLVGIAEMIGRSIGI